MKVADPLARVRPRRQPPSAPSRGGRARLPAAPRGGAGWRDLQHHLDLHPVCDHEQEDCVRPARWRRWISGGSSEPSEKSCSALNPAPPGGALPSPERTSAPHRPHLWAVRQSPSTGPDRGRSEFTPRHKADFKPGCPGPGWTPPPARRFPATPLARPTSKLGSVRWPNTWPPACLAPPGAWTSPLVVVGAPKTAGRVDKDSQPASPL